MDNISIINASPLIFFTRSKHLNLLKEFSNEIWVPDAVASEILTRGDDDITAIAIKETEWITQKSPISVPINILEWRLGKGESGVIALALEHGFDAIIDDLQGRKCAASMNVPVRGTLGIVLVAKQRGLIPTARPIMEDMMNAGLYLSKKVLNKALALVDE